MKYFTQELWVGFNSGRSRREAAFKTYDRRFLAYKRRLALLLPKLNTQARRFFSQIGLLHDGTLARFDVGDCIDDFALGRKGVNGRRLRVRLFVLSENFDWMYVLQYKDVSRVGVDFPGKLVLFPDGRHANFGDWGYAELTGMKGGLFRHEILFASGATITIEFKNFAFRRTRSSTPKGKRFGARQFTLRT